MTLEARSFGHRCLDHLVLDFHPRRPLATEPPLALFCRLRRLRRLVHAAWCAWLDIRAALQAFQPGDLFALFADNLFQFADLADERIRFRLAAQNACDLSGTRRGRDDPG